MADVVIVNAKTGERVERAFTPEELAQREADAAAAAVEQAAKDAEKVAKKAEKDAVLAKLKITEAEFQSLLEG